MVQGDLDSEKVDCTDINNIESKSLGSGIRRELSFSRWCDEDGRVHLDKKFGDADVGVEEDSDFELLFLEKDQLHVKFQHKSIHMNGVGTMGDDSIYLRGNGSEKYVPFDIENGAVRGKVGVDSCISEASHGSFGKSSTNPISIADILKTLFFILVWYTSSLFLTL